MIYFCQSCNIAIMTVINLSNASPHFNDGINVSDIILFNVKEEILLWEKWRHRTLLHTASTLRSCIRLRRAWYKITHFAFINGSTIFVKTLTQQYDCRGLTDRDVSLLMIFSRTILACSMNPRNRTRADTLIELNSTIYTRSCHECVARVSSINDVYLQVYYSTQLMFRRRNGS